MGDSLARFTFTHFLGLFGIENHTERLIVIEVVPYPVEQHNDFVAHTQNRTQMHYKPQHPSNKALHLDFAELCHSLVPTNSRHRTEIRSEEHTSELQSP